MQNKSTAQASEMELQESVQRMAEELEQNLDQTINKIQQKFEPFTEQSTICSSALEILLDARHNWVVYQHASQVKWILLGQKCTFIFILIITECS
mmetsp:Transcript_14139/g.20195  ORF Transcript_14139/g.20195 Transcript_14139/m.20195 type:complete len:95 (-) Transcript_14139:547-831(-)